MTEQKEQKKPVQKGFRPGIDKKQIMKGMTDADWQRIKAQKEFETIKEGTVTWKLALYCDTLRKLTRKHKLDIMHKLWNIRNVQRTNKRLQAQLDKGPDFITEKTDKGVLMNETEVKILIDYNTWLERGDAEYIPQVLAEIRKFVGNIDYSREVVLSEQEFERYAKEVLDELTSYGYDLLADIPLARKA